MKAQVALVDDHPLFRQGLAVTLRGEADLEVVCEAGSAAEAVELAKHVALDVVVVDLLMPATPVRAQVKARRSPSVSRRVSRDAATHDLTEAAASSIHGPCEDR